VVAMANASKCFFMGGSGWVDKALLNVTQIKSVF
jgi:hypothetical protein